MSNLNDLSLTELKELAKTCNIKNISKLKKEDLVTVLEQVLSEAKLAQALGKEESNETNKNEEYYYDDEYAEKKEHIETQ